MKNEIRAKSVYDDIKSKFPEALSRNHGLVSRACKEFNIRRQTYYDWYNAYPDFARACDEAREDAIDFTEGHMFRRIEEGSDRMIIFHLSMQAKHRGYGSDIIPLISDAENKILDIELLEKYIEKELTRRMANKEAEKLALEHQKENNG